MLDADKSHLDVTWVSQDLYSGPLSNPDFFLSLIAGRIRQVVLYANFSLTFFGFDMSLLFVTVTLRGVSNKHCLLSLFSF